MATTMNDGSQTLQPGSTVGVRYRVLRLLGKGGMGAVYEAENTWTKRRVALKVMRPELARNAAYAQRFLQEAQAASQLAHPNIVDVLDMAEDAELGSLYIVQEFLMGHDLRVHIDAAVRLSVREALELIVPVMEALVVAHGRGIVHRDLKPDNIFLAETTRGIVPKVIDFGIAKVVDGDGRSRQETNDGTIMGTAYYMAPEQASGDTALDARADVWALGVVLYEMLSGMRPYEANTTNALIAKIIYEDPKPLTEAAPDLPADLVEAVMGALQRGLTKRHPTMQTFLDALRGCAVVRDERLGADSGARTSGSVPGLMSTAVLPPQSDAVPARSQVGETIAPRVETLPPDTGMERSARRARTWKVAAGTALLVGLAAIAAAAFRSPPSATRSASGGVLRPLAVAAPVTPVEVQPTGVPRVPRAIVDEPPREEPVVQSSPVEAHPLRQAISARPVGADRRARPRPAVPAAPRPGPRQSPPSITTRIPIPLP